VPDAVKYQITRSAPPAGQTVLPPVPDTVYLDQDVQTGKTYYYSVQAMDASGTAGLKAGSSPVTMGSASTAAAVSTNPTNRAIRPVTVFTARPFPHPYVALNWAYSQGGVYFIIERAVLPAGSKGALSWEPRIKTGPLPCCHWGELDEIGGLKAATDVIYRVTAVDTAAAGTKSSAVTSDRIHPGTTQSYVGAKPGEFYAEPRPGQTITLRLGSPTNISTKSGGRSGGLTTMDPSIAAFDGGALIPKAVGVTYAVTVDKADDGSPRITPYRVLVVP
jgi:hypothetical protein